MNGTDLQLAVDDAERLVVAVAAGEIDVPDPAKALAPDP
jgi:prophage maintenance system killer protein